jgi:hypothetical protein
MLANVKQTTQSIEEEAALTLMIEIHRRRYTPCIDKLQILAPKNPIL